MQTTSSASSLPPGGGRRWLEFYRASSEKWPRWKKIALCIGAIGAITIIALSATLAVNLRRGCEETTSTKGNTTSLITVTDTKVSTRTATVTAIPRPDPNFLPACWGNLMSICSNNTQVPKDGVSNGFGACSEVYRYFYCGLITSLTDDGLRFCSNMKDLCTRAQLLQTTTTTTGPVTVTQTREVTRSLNTNTPENFPDPAATRIII